MDELIERALGMLSVLPREFVIEHFISQSCEPEEAFLATIAAEMLLCYREDIGQVYDQYSDDMAESRQLLE
jgi:hypothetical protein